jgi:hypothetical protein
MEKMPQIANPRSNGSPIHRTPSLSKKDCRDICAVLHDSGHNIFGQSWYSKAAKAPNIII